MIVKKNNMYKLDFSIAIIYLLIILLNSNVVNKNKNIHSVNNLKILILLNVFITIMGFLIESRKTYITIFMLFIKLPLNLYLAWNIYKNLINNNIKTDKTEIDKKKSGNTENYQKSSILFFKISLAVSFSLNILLLLEIVKKF